MTIAIAEWIRKRRNVRSWLKRDAIECQSGTVRLWTELESKKRKKHRKETYMYPAPYAATTFKPGMV